MDLLASWGRRATERRREAYRRATAPSPPSARRASMETQEKHTNTCRKEEGGGASAFLDSGDGWQVGNSITASFCNCPVCSWVIWWQLLGSWRRGLGGCEGCRFAAARWEKSVWNLTLSLIKKCFVQSSQGWKEKTLNGANQRKGGLFLFFFQTLGANGSFNWDNNSLVNREIDCNTQQAAKSLDIRERGRLNPNLIKHHSVCSPPGVQSSLMTLLIR